MRHHTTRYETITEQDRQHIQHIYNNNNTGTATQPTKPQYNTHNTHTLTPTKCLTYHTIITYNNQHNHMNCHLKTHHGHHITLPTQTQQHNKHRTYSSSPHTMAQTHAQPPTHIIPTPNHTHLHTHLHHIIAENPHITYHDHRIDTPTKYQTTCTTTHTRHDSTHTSHPMQTRIILDNTVTTTHIQHHTIRQHQRSHNHT